jgi:predicted DNA-binding transcriptional regulator AlpA
VASAVLDALAGEEPALALAATDEVADRRRRVTKAAELAVERARYQAERAERAFLAIEPENRLVARSLENRWESRLAELAEAEAALAVKRQQTQPLPSRDELEEAVADLPGLWAADTTSARDRKRLLRTLIADVTLLPEPDQHKCRLGLRWRSGSTEEFVVDRQRAPRQWRAANSAAIALARERGPDLDNAELAAELNAAGHHTGTGRPFDRMAAGSLRHYYRIPSPQLLQDGELTVPQVASRLGVSENSVINWIAAGALTARRGPSGRWCIPFDPDTEAAWRARVAASPHIHTDTEPYGRQPGELAVIEIANRLGVDPDVIYHWNERGYLPSRRGKGGRIWVTFDSAVDAACRQRVADSHHLPAAIKSQACN